MNFEDGGNGKLRCEESENLLTVMTVQQLSLASYALCCRSFRSSPGGNFTPASCPLQFVLLCFIRNCGFIMLSFKLKKAKEKIKAIFRAFLGTCWRSLSASALIYYFQAHRKENRNTWLWIEHHFKFIYEYVSTNKSFQRFLFLQDPGRGWKMRLRGS